MELINNILQNLNPANVNWSEFGDIFQYVITIVIAVALVGAVVFAIIRRDIVLGFLKSTYEELKKVEWLSRSMTVRYSVLTITIVAIFTVFIVASDEILLFVRNLIVLGGN